MIGLQTKELIKQQCPPYKGAVVDWHNDLQFTGDLDFRAVSFDNGHRQFTDSIALVLSDTQGEAVNLYVYPNPAIENNAKRPFSLDSVTGQAVILGNPKNVDTYAILGLDSAKILYDGLTAKHGKACVYALPDGLQACFLNMIQAFKPTYVVTTHDKKDELQTQVNIKTLFYSLSCPLAQIAPPHQTVTSDWLDENLFLSADIIENESQTLLQARRTKLQAEIRYLATLDEMDFDLSLGEVAKKIGLPQTKIAQYVADYKQGDMMGDIEPYHEPINAGELYGELYNLIDSHVVIDEPYKVAFVLWVIFTYLVDIATFAPLAWITAPEKACGKSTLLALFGRVVNRKKEGSSITPAVLFRVMEKYKPTLLIDEIDTSLKDNNELLGIINAGHSKHAPYVFRYDTDSKSEKGFNVFGAKVFCGIGGMKGTFASRAIRFEMRRKTNQDKPILRMNEQDLPTPKTDLIKAKIKRWTNDNRQAVANTKINTIKELKDRDFDNWYILLQIASVLGVYDKALQACLAICQTESEPSLNEQLLNDIRYLMGERSYIGTTELLDKLTGDDELAWATYNRGQPLSNYQLATRLRAFGVKSQNKRSGRTVIKVYFASDLHPVFERYLPPPSADEFNPF